MKATEKKFAKLNNKKKNIQSKHLMEGFCKYFKVSQGKTL